uniref:Putative nuclease HARBI1 n=1 Tax=Cricetulus griseus TaxID=10029 RepID=A0A8C2MVR7_CRIGR
MAVPITVLDCDLLLYGRGHRTLDRFKLDDVTDEYLMSMYGFPRQFIYYLVELLGASLSRPTQRSRAISPETQILAALGFYTSGSFQTRMGDAIGISQASMSRCVAHVTEALVERASQFIHFPADEAAVQSLKDEFYGLAGMPGVIGVVDCIHVAIKAPNAEDLSYVNRKGLHSLNCLIVCDIRGALMTVETSWPGSLQDCAVLQQSSLSSQFETGMHKDSWLLGKFASVNLQWCLCVVLVGQE